MRLFNKLGFRKREKNTENHCLEHRQLFITAPADNENCTSRLIDVWAKTPI